MEALPSVSIVIPTLNEEAYLPRLLESLLRANSPMEVLVVAGESKDRPVEVVQEFVPRFSVGSSLRLLRASRGVALQRNLGGNESHHDIIMFLDADTEIPSPGSYRKLIAEFEKRQYVVAG